MLLCGEVVDVRYFYAIEKETVLRRASSSDHQVVSESSRRCHTRKRLHDPGYVPVSSGTFLDLFESDHAQSERTFCRLAERRGDNAHFLQAFTTFFQLDRKKHVLVGNSEFSRNCWFITDKGGLQAIASGRDSGDLELADRISDSPFYRVPDDDIGEANRFAVGGIFYNPFY